MPIRPPRICRAPGCGKTTPDGGYCAGCDAVRRKRVAASRPTAAGRGYDGRWAKARIGFLRKHPLCRSCDDLGVTTAATVVDHVTPHKGDKVLFWDRLNWQALCKRCHDRKTAFESRFGRAPSPTTPGRVTDVPISALPIEVDDMP